MFTVCDKEQIILDWLQLSPGVKISQVPAALAASSRKKKNMLRFNIAAPSEWDYISRFVITQVSLVNFWHFTGYDQIKQSFSEYLRNYFGRT